MRIIRTLMTFLIASSMLIGMCSLLISSKVKLITLATKLPREEVTKENAKLYVEIENLRTEIRRLDARYRSHLTAQAPIYQNGSKISEELKFIRKEIKITQDEMCSLREAINPKSSEQLLTIARITDKLASVSEDIKRKESAINQHVEDIDKRQNQRIEDLRIAFIREIDSLRNILFWIFTALLPVSVSIILPMWIKKKDVSRVERGDTERYSRRDVAS